MYCTLRIIVNKGSKYEQVPIIKACSFTVNILILINEKFIYLMFIN